MMEHTENPGEVVLHADADTRDVHVEQALKDVVLYVREHDKMKKVRGQQ